MWCVGAGPAAPSLNRAAALPRPARRREQRCAAHCNPSCGAGATIGAAWPGADHRFDGAAGVSIKPPPDAKLLRLLAFLNVADHRFRHLVVLGEAGDLHARRRAVAIDALEYFAL